MPGFASAMRAAVVANAGHIRRSASDKNILMYFSRSTIVISVLMC